MATGTTRKQAQYHGRLLLKSNLECIPLQTIVFSKAQARKNKQDKCESLNRVKKVLPSLAPFQLGIFSNVAGSPHGDVVFDWVVNCVTAIAQGLVDGKIPASQQIYNAICERTIISSACAERLVALIRVRAQQAESAGKGFTWLPAFEQLTLALKEHHDESNYDRILPCSAAFAIRLGRTYKPSTTFGAEAFSTILNFVHKELRGTKVQNDTFTRLLAFNSFQIFHVNEAGLPDAPHTAVQKLIQAMSSFGISETAANPSAVRKGGTTHDLFSEDEVAFRVYIELGNLLVLKAIRARPEANKAIEKIVKDLDDLYAAFRKQCAQNLSTNTGNNTHVQLGFNLEFIATSLNEISSAFDGLPCITSTSESVAKQVSNATEFAMSATATPATHSDNKGKGRKGGKGKGNGRQNDGGNGNNQRGTRRDPDNSRNGANSAIVTRKNESPFLRAFGTTGRQEPSENDAALQMMIRNTMTLWLVLHNIELENKGF